MSEYLELTNWTLTKELLEKIRNTKGNNCVTMPLDLFEDMIENLEEQQAEIQALKAKQVRLRPMSELETSKRTLGFLAFLQNPTTVCLQP